MARGLVCPGPAHGRDSALRLARAMPGRDDEAAGTAGWWRTCPVGNPMKSSCRDRRCPAVASRCLKGLACLGPANGRHGARRAARALPAPVDETVALAYWLSMCPVRNASKFGRKDRWCPAVMRGYGKTNRGPREPRLGADVLAPEARSCLTHAAGHPSSGCEPHTL